MNYKSDFIKQLRTSLPGLHNQPLEDLVSENLISPFTIQLPSSILAQAKKAIELIFSMREKESYLAHYKKLIEEQGLRDPGNKSIMMSYDFHVDENHNLKLIEINTNAAFLLLGHQMYQAKAHPLPVPDFSLKEIGDCIQTEMALQGKKISSDFKIAITDEAPETQKLYVEFLAFNELFKSYGWNSRIQDYRELFANVNHDFIYNRFTDFFLTDSDSVALRSKFLNRDICLSPNPFEYLLLADKQRLIDWVSSGFFESLNLPADDISFLRQCIPLSYDLHPEKADEIWSQRKRFFFKPKNAFGSKQSFRGGTISRTAYNKITTENMIAQEYIPASEISFETPEGPQTFKYDLRCYAYQGRLQLVVARIYQGQVTNLRAKYGGFATVLFQ